MNYETEIQSSINYLKSDAAQKTVQTDAYWPKWNSPWWHMLLLHEMGETHQIPESIVEAYVASLNRIPLKIFPIHSHEMPEGVDPYRGSPCHCQVGNVYQVLAKFGIDVDQELPWIRPWFLQYQMPVATSRHPGFCDFRIAMMSPFEPSQDQDSYFGVAIGYGCWYAVPLEDICKKFIRS